MEISTVVTRQSFRQEAHHDVGPSGAPALYRQGMILLMRLSRLIRHEITTWIVGISTALAAHEASTAFVDCTEGRKVFLLPYIAVFAVLTLLFYWLYENPLPKKLSTGLDVKVTLIGAVPWLVGAAAFMFLFAVGTQLHHAFDADNFAPRLLLIDLLLFAVSVVTLYRLRNDVLVVHSRYLEQEKMASQKHGARHLVLILSDVKEVYRQSGWLPADMNWSAPADLEKDLIDLVAIKKRGAPNWPWEMPLRALKPHRGRVEAITLLCSPESIKQAAAFGDLVRRYLDFGDLKVNVWVERKGVRSLTEASEEALRECAGFDFNKVDDLSSAMVDLLKYLRFKMRLKPREIMIDYTGGQKPVSFVAAAVTLRGEVRAQYVDTNSLEPIEYDLVANPEPRSF